ncbi:NAD(P)-dependent oxidoreductase [Staphylococcus canis]|uniref:NAD(P)H-binding protein n=1 Tax=Staphylococcus canis TaxID=2724942 RepID=A0ABS0TAJ9_9STAP|nr:NAD(P)H-binding protein [Staphylococcus canis]MBI5975738.1 NAD(P)H-binding protein [Staphylococcus canis]
MKIGIIGATGKQGYFLTEQAITRGHDVTALIRNASKLKFDIPYIEKDILDIQREDIQDFDVVICAFRAPQGHEDLYISVTNHLADLVKGTSIRLMFVGGAGRLYLDKNKTKRVVDNRGIPSSMRPTVENMVKAYEALTQTQDVNWTYVSPSGNFDFNGPETGEYRIGTDYILTNNNGESYVSYKDYSLAFLDEVEKNEHPNQGIMVVSNS